MGLAEGWAVNLVDPVVLGHEPGDDGIREPLGWRGGRMGRRRRPNDVFHALECLFGWNFRGFQRTSVGAYDSLELRG